MKKPFFYRETVYISDSEDVIVEVILPNGSIGISFINIPGDNDKYIENEGDENIGKWENLKKSPTLITADIENIISGVDQIKYHLKINDKLVIKHEKPKKNNDMHQIAMIITFKLKSN